MSDTPYPPNMSATDNVILFDGVCKLCNAWSRFIIKYDKQQIFKLCSVQSDEGQQILRYFGLQSDYYESMLVVDGNQYFERSDAFFEVMSKLGYPHRILCTFRFIPKVIRDWMYDRIALNRYLLFGKYDACIVTNPDHEDRFLVRK